MEFLSKLVSGDEESISSDTLETVKEWPVPTTVKELQSFHGFMNYHKNLIQNFAKISDDLHVLVH